MSKSISVRINKSGDIRGVYSPQLANILGKLGMTRTKRASHVEPGDSTSQDALRILHRRQFGRYTIYDGETVKIRGQFSQHWFADMTPCGLDIVLGPYSADQRDAALRDEVRTLREHGFPCE